MEKLLQKNLPALSSHLADLGITPAMYTTEVIILIVFHIVVYVCLFAFFPIRFGCSCMGYFPCRRLDYRLSSGSCITETLSKWSLENDMICREYDR